MLFSFSHKSKFQITRSVSTGSFKTLFKAPFFVPATGGVSATPISNFKTVHDTATKITQNYVLILSN